MGNALDFLNKKRDKSRKDVHNTECKKKVDKFLETNKITEEPDCMIVQGGKTGSLSINHKNLHIQSLPGLNARRMAKEEANKEPETKCICCKEMFPSILYKRKLTLKEIESGNNGYQQYCLFCKEKTREHKYVIEKYGKEKYLKYIINATEEKNMSRYDSLRTLFEIQEAKKALGHMKENVNNRIIEIIKKAHRLNKRIDNDNDLDLYV